MPANNEKPHKFKVGDLVQYNEYRLKVTRLTRDYCDGTPIYAIGFKVDTDNHLTSVSSIGEDDLQLVSDKKPWLNL